MLLCREAAKAYSDIFGFITASPPLTPRVAVIEHLLTACALSVTKSCLFSALNFSGNYHKDPRRVKSDSAVGASLVNSITNAWPAHWQPRIDAPFQRVNRESQCGV